MVSIIDVIKDIKLNIKFLVVYFLFFFIASVSLPNFIKPIYKAESTVIVNSCRDPDPLLITNLALCPEIFVKNEIITSESLLRGYAEHLKEQYQENFKEISTVKELVELGDNKSIARKMRESNIRIFPDTGRGLLRISFLANAPNEAALITNDYVQFVIDFLKKRNTGLLRETITNLENNPANNKKNIRSFIALELYENFEKSAVIESTSKELEVLDIAYPPDSRFAPSFRLMFIQINLIGIILIFIIYFIRQYLHFIRKDL